MTFEIEGFLSDSMAHRFSAMPECVEWFSLATKLSRIGHGMAYSEKEFQVEKGLSDVKSLVTLLFFRALSNFQGAILLAERGLIVEAGTLARSCGECALSLVGAKFDPEHWKAMLGDEASSRMGRSKLLLKNEAWLNTDQVSELRKQVELMEQRGRVSRLDYGAIAKLGGVEVHYLLYRQLSADSAHVSLESLRRYVKHEPDGSFQLQPAPSEPIPTICTMIDVACNFFCLCLIVYLEYFPDQSASGEVSVSWHTYKRLAESRRKPTPSP